MTANNLLRLWASICSNLDGDTTNVLSHLLPSFDKTIIINPNGIETIYLNYLKKINISQKSFALPPTPTDFGNDKVVATFIMDLPKIKKLKKWVLSRIIEKTNKEPSFNLSAVVVTCAYVWACLIKALGGDSLREQLAIPIDCRTRLDPALPEAYFGNCLMVSFTAMNNNDLVGKDGIVVAAEVIGKAIHTIAKSVFDGSENLLANLISLRSEASCDCWFTKAKGL
ncbi:hypothetical protein GIB67_015222 [Kingdonia uniflora]|uniref:Uncharacterized protein n=1 Tax=Kingdonia uniflora TaxID=39325 RepID=A0A7J7MSP7_9MAGN|nr:hypothetical protein GIB67_015222 [Kingdonia uniflora]